MDAYNQSLYVSYQSSGKYTNAQLRELEMGLEKALQVGFYANPVLLPEQMAQIRIGLEHGIDVTSYSGSYWYHYLQMAEIREGLEAGIDISYYDDVSYTAELMRIIRMGLEAGLDVVWYANPIYSISQASLIYEGLRQGLDVRFYANPSYESEQMLVIKKGLESGLDVSLYTDSRFSFMQMTQIRQGLELGIDVRTYAKLEYDEKQMWQIKAGLMEQLDISCYADPAFNANQMQEIRLGLKSGIDISLYCDPLFTYEEMRQVRTIFTRHRKTHKTGERPSAQPAIREETIERFEETHTASFSSRNGTKDSRRDTDLLPEILASSPAAERDLHRITKPNPPVIENRTPERDIIQSQQIAGMPPEGSDSRFNGPNANEDRLIQKPHINTAKPDILLPSPPDDVIRPVWREPAEKRNSHDMNQMAADGATSHHKIVSTVQDISSQETGTIAQRNISPESKKADSPIHTDKPAIKQPSSSETAKVASSVSMQGNNRPAGAPQEIKKRHNVFYNMTKAANAGRPAISPRELFGVSNNTDADS